MDEPFTKFEIVQKRAAGEKAPSVSEYFITVSTNKVDDALTDEERAAFEEAMTRVWSRPYALLRVPPGEKGLGELRLPDRSKIDSINVQLALEVGSVRGVLHCHLRLTVRHRCRVQLDFGRVGTILRELCGEGVYFKAQFVRNQEAMRIENYLTKHFVKTFKE
jgi:hypothetical protein